MTLITRCRQWPITSALVCSPGGPWWPGTALLTLVLALRAPIVAADAQPELEFQPSTVSLAYAAAQQATALVVLHNRSAATLRDLRLTWLPATGLDVQPSPPLSLSALPPHGDFVWTLTIKPICGLPTPGVAGLSAVVKPASPSAGPAPAGPSALAANIAPAETHIDQNLDLRLEYESVGDREIKQVILKSLPVKTQDFGNLDKDLDVQIKTALESLESSESGSIYLVFKNNSARTISISSITPVGKGELYCKGKKVRPEDESLPFCFSSTTAPAILTPYQSLVEQLPVKARERGKAGEYLLLFQIATQFYENGIPLRHSVVVSQTVTVGVVGESAVLKVAGIPAFFLLPGMLLLLTIGLCRSLEGRWWPVASAEKFSLEFRQANFWLVSVTISLVIAFVPWLFTGRWYFTRYGLQHIASYWLCSILLGVFLYALWWTVRHNYKLRAEELERMRTLREARETKHRTSSEGDSPIETLQKLQRNREG